MTESTSQPFDTQADYVAALAQLCGLAEHTLFLFEKNFDRLGFDSEACYEQLRHFLLAGAGNRLYLLVQDDSHLTRFCPRIMNLLQSFAGSMQLHRMPKQLQHISAPLAIADGIHCLRRFHFDQPQGILTLNDDVGTAPYKSQFLEMWHASLPAAAGSKLHL